jgi:hypothetical protein
MIQVRGHSGLFRDEQTGAIINTSPEYTQYTSARELRAAQLLELNKLKDEVKDIKEMLNLIIARV